MDQLKRKKNVPLQQIATTNQRKMSETDRAKELGRKAFEFLYLVFYGPPLNAPHTYDRAIQISLVSLWQFTDAKKPINAAELNDHKERVTIIQDLIPTIPLLNVGIGQNFPDVEDVDIITREAHYKARSLLSALNMFYSFELPLVQYPATSLSGNETT
ncbi:uncharacterized protein LOC119083162 [Bradysia coprophila]|uniref:uncharacterized protein LOC119083162 n=1 Tax=Bradysia coprophila TaxID=38358 RepID=UPI00187DAEE2|nr:uncharacterized protein LOC119083162 [Bradysia coprophila]